MFDFGQANPGQKEAIQTVDGPLLIIAGPGTGKTFTLVKRALYMIRERGVKPEQIMLATFTEKAAKELITRISNELARQETSLNINDMYIGTFHSICYRLIEEYPDETHVGKNYRSLDAFEQRYIVFRDLISGNSLFGQIKGLYTVIDEKNPWGFRTNKWDHAGQICQIVNELTEELVSPEALTADAREYVAVVGQIQSCYAKLLSAHNYLDFAGSQAKVYSLLRDHPNVLSEMRKKIRYLMVDEYQDTNHIQEQIVLLLAGEAQNICVVGDDDQGLYRFRGATVQNILTFPENFEPGRCRTVKLTTNYRSDPDIVSFYDRWMHPAANGFQWGEYRHPKSLEASKAKDILSPAVVKLAVKDNEEAWKQENLDFVKALLSSGKITDLNQIAFLFNTVRSKRIRALAEHFEQNGIRVYSPRSNLFFERSEVMLLLGFLMLCFPAFVKRLETRDFPFQNKRLNGYYDSCLAAARNYLRSPEGAPLKDFIDRTGGEHAPLRKNAAYNFTGLIYRMFAFEPFQSMLSQDLRADVIAQRPARNLSLLVACLGKYEYLYQIDCLKPDRMDRDAYYLFSSFMNCLMNGGITEYEDQSRYAPSGCVSFLTIHQSKGLEFPVVVVGSLGEEPKQKAPGKFDVIRDAYYGRKPFEPLASTGTFDFLRLFYTAFSRAQNLLVLTANTGSAEPGEWFRDCFAALPGWRDKGFRIGDFSFDTVKDVNLKEAYSFTSHISVYETCPRQYKFFKELCFSPARVSATVFGTLIHQTIEDMHKAALRGEAHRITEANIRAWLNTNYATISESEHILLSPAQREAAFRQAVRYAERQRGRWDRIRDAEVDISVVKPDYILKGTVDLIRGEGDTLEIVDFKSDKRPGPDGDGGRTEHYKKQLQIYAHLVQQRTGRPVSRMHLYYTGDESGTPTLTFENDPVDVEATLREFDGVVHRIMEKDFTEKAANRDNCNSCDFQYYCHGSRREPVARRPAPTGGEGARAKETAPLCPLCGAVKVLRTNRSTGEQFWGCPNYRSHKRG